MPTINKNKITYISKITITIVIFFSLVAFPKETFEASLRGLNTWWNIVLPALLPFFIMSQILISLNIIKIFGVLLEPIMKPLFGLPGTGAFVLAIGYTSGAPISSIITANLRKKQLLSVNEAEKLICFTSNASPLFMFGAIAIGMFNRAEIGVIIAISHYSANLLIGFLLRFWFKNKQRMCCNSHSHPHKKPINTMFASSLGANAPLGSILSDAIKQSIHTLIQIGGFITLFSVIIELLSLFYIIDIISFLLTIIFFPLGIELDLARGITSGFVEMTIGAKLIADSTSPLRLKIAALSLILGWSGLSIHAQSLSMLNGTDIRFFPFVISRALHGSIAALISLLISEPAITVLSLSGFSSIDFSASQIVKNSWVAFLVIIVILFTCSRILTRLSKVFNKPC
jgi:sporulation integral membrane protein YlbJ